MVNLMGYIKKINGTCSTPYYYYCVKIKVAGQWTERIVRPATLEEIAASHTSKDSKKDIALMTCANPDCDKQIKIPRSQKRRFNTTYPKRYNRFQMVYCSEDCQQAHDKVLRGD